MLAAGGQLRRTAAQPKWCRYTAAALVGAQPVGADRARPAARSSGTSTICTPAIESAGEILQGADVLPLFRPDPDVHVVAVLGVGGFPEDEADLVEHGRPAAAPASAAPSPGPTRRRCPGESAPAVRRRCPARRRRPVCRTACRRWRGRPCRWSEASSSSLPYQCGALMSMPVQFGPLPARGDRLVVGIDRLEVRDHDRVPRVGRLLLVEQFPEIDVRPPAVDAVLDQPLDLGHALLVLRAGR